MPQLPFVSVLTPTFNRRKFIPYLIDCFKAQDYPQERMEWIILDDGVDKTGDIFSKCGLPNLRYYSENKKMKIGAKRNKLNMLAKGDIIVCIDDDDYNPPDRVSHVVHMLKSRPKYEICGGSEMYLYYTDIDKIYRVGPYGPNHCTNGTMAYRKSYLKNHKYDETVTHAEEKSFLNNYTEPMIQLNPMKVCLVISHKSNTFDKVQLRDNNPKFQLTNLDISTFIKSDKLLKYYANI
jgi:glycosyltransferase involved in cell wall biosynthesis